MTETKVTDSRTNLVTRDEMRRYLGTQFERTDWTCFRVFLGTSMFNIPNFTDTKILLDTATFDLRGEFDLVTNNHFVADQGGIYEFGGNMAILGLTSLDDYIARIFVNAALHTILHSHEATAVVSGNIGGSVIIELDAGDTVDWNYKISNSAGASDIAGGTSSTYFWGKKIRERINP